MDLTEREARDMIRRLRYAAERLRRDAQDLEAVADEMERRVVVSFSPGPLQ